MNTETRIALLESIAHWERMRDGQRITSRSIEQYETPFSCDCPLCDLYHMGGTCDEGCPIRADTGKDKCNGTTWSKAASGLLVKVDTNNVLHSTVHHNRPITDKQKLKWINDFIDYMKKLLLEKSS